MSDLTLASDINTEYRLARAFADNAIAHAIRCGELLLAKKARLSHGKFKRFIQAHCDFAYSTAARYMKAANQKSMGVDFPSLSQMIYNVPKVTHYTGNQEWYTPARYVEAARRVMGGIDLDPATCVAANETVKASNFYTKDNSGLENEWAGRVWLNPPYSCREIEQFVDRLCTSYAHGHISQAVMLTNASSSSKWWQQACAASDAICQVSGRISFNKNGVEAKSSPIDAQTFFYFGRSVSAFYREFTQYGVVLVKCPGSVA